MLWGGASCRIMGFVVQNIRETVNLGRFYTYTDTLPSPILIYSSVGLIYCVRIWPILPWELQEGQVFAGSGPEPAGPLLRLTWRPGGKAYL